MIIIVLLQHLPYNSLKINKMYMYKRIDVYRNDYKCVFAVISVVFGSF